MSAKSKKQQMAAGAALAAKRGKRSKSSLKGASSRMVKSMSEKQLRDFAKIRRKKLPAKKAAGNDQCMSPRKRRIPLRDYKRPVTARIMTINRIKPSPPLG
jgi:hypothetical protein